MELKTLQEIQRLRNEINLLYAAEGGRGANGGGGGYKGFHQMPGHGSNGSGMFHDEYNDPPKPHHQDHLVLSEASSGRGGGHGNGGGGGYKRKICCTLFGIGFVVGTIALIANTFDFMNTNGIELIPSGPGSQMVSLATLQLHNTEDDCWVVYYGQVYDVTVYAANRHPAGPEWITPDCGADGTENYR